MRAETYLERIQKIDALLENKKQEHQREKALQAEYCLEKIKRIDALLEKKKQEYRRQISISESTGGGLSFVGKTQGTMDPHRRAAAIGESIVISEQIEALETERADLVRTYDLLSAAEYDITDKQTKALESERAAIIKTLELLPTPEYKLLYKIYAEGYMVKQVPSALKMSYDWVKKTKAKALQHVQKILDSRQSTP